MSVLIGSLYLLLTAQDVQPAASPAPLRTPCELTDNACKAEEFVEKSKRAAPALRATYLFGAHRSYLAAFAKTGEPRHLCAARKSLDRSLAVPGQSAKQLADFQAARPELEALEQKYAIRCDTRRRARPEAPAIAQNVASTPTQVPAEAPAVAPQPEPPDGLLAVPVVASSNRVIRPVAHRQRVDATRPVDTARSPGPIVAPRRDASRPGRPLIIAGGTTLGLGLALVGVAGYAGSRVADSSRAAFDLYEQSQGLGNADSLAAQASLRREFDRWLPVTVGTAIAGTTAVIVGAVLVRVGVRRMKQDPSRAALVPVPGGLAIRARF
jgi:hypothetical protein